jgi:hypothetical protein
MVIAGGPIKTLTNEAFSCDMASVRFLAKTVFEQISTVPSYLITNASLHPGSMTASFSLAKRTTY